MSDPKPDWYARLKSGPFKEPIFDREMQRSVEMRTLNEAAKTRDRRRIGKIAGIAAIAAAVLTLCVLLFVQALGDPLRMVSGSGGSPTMTIAYVSAHLHVGMSEGEVKKGFGKPTEGMSVRQDFGASRSEDISDLNTWAAVDVWRYDYGIRDDYEVESDLAVNVGADRAGVERGDLSSQLIIVWKDGLVERAFYWYKDENGLASAQFGPQTTSPVPSPSQPTKKEGESTPEVPESSPEHSPEPTPADSLAITPPLPAANAGVRAVGESSAGVFEIRPKDGGDEQIRLLGAPSCLGQETDLEYRGDYEVYFRDASGKETLVRELVGIDIIQRSDAAVQMRNFDLPGNKELFLFIPRYTDCHGLEFYAFGVDKKAGEPASFTFEQIVTTILEDGTESTNRSDIPYWTTSPVVDPVVADSRLIVEGGRWAGQDGAARYTFKPDWSQHRMLIEKEVQIP